MVRDITPIFYKNQIIYFHQSDSYKWLIDEKSLIKLFQVQVEKLIEIQNKLDKDKHFISEKVVNIETKKSDQITLWSRKGVIKVAYLLNSQQAFDIVDDLEDIELIRKESMFRDVENILHKRLSEISKNGTFKDIEDFVGTLSTFLKERDRFSNKKDMGMKSMLFDIFEDALKTVQK